MSKFTKNVSMQIDAGANAIWVYVAGDFARAARDLSEMCSDTGRDIYFWDCNAGASWCADELDKRTDPVKMLRDLGTAKIGAWDGPAGPRKGCIVVFRDGHTYLNSTGTNGVAVRRQLSTLCNTQALNNSERIAPVIVLSSVPTPHEEIAELFDFVDYALPTLNEMAVDAVDYCFGIRTEAEERAAAKAKKATGTATPASVQQAPDVSCSPEVREKLARALLGLSSLEAQRILSVAIGSECSPVITESILPKIADAKARVLRKTDGLTFIPYASIPDADNIGGFTEFKRWLQIRARVYSPEARDLGIELPRGAALIGPPGSGKTMVAKAAAKILGRDLVILDVGAMFEKYIGASEGRMRKALATVSAIPSAMLLVDEVDKAFGRAHETQANDGGAASRVFSYFLSWLSERDMSSSSTGNNAFVIVTMNRISGMPPEFLRAGRFDRTWATDLPDAAEREEILRIHLRQRGIDSAVYGKGLQALVQATEQFTGAELQELIIDARATTFAARLAAAATKQLTIESIRPTIDELLAAASAITPVARLFPEELEITRQYCRKCAFPVNGRPEVPTVSVQRKPRRVVSGHNFENN